MNAATAHVFRSFDSWDAVLLHASKHLPLFYMAPLDIQPVRLWSRTPSTRPVPGYEARARTVRIFPPGCEGRGKRRTADPFTADAGHLSRFRWLETLIA